MVVFTKPTGYVCFTPPGMPVGHVMLIEFLFCECVCFNVRSRLCPRSAVVFVWESTGQRVESVLIMTVGVWLRLYNLCSCLVSLCQGVWFFYVCITCEGGFVFIFLRPVWVCVCFQESLCGCTLLQVSVLTHRLLNFFAIL